MPNSGHAWQHVSTHKQLEGEFPSDWKRVSLNNIATFITSGSRGWAAYYSNDGPLFLRIGNLTREHINLRLDDVVHVHPPIGSEGARTAVQEGDILISMVDPGSWTVERAKIR